MKIHKRETILTLKPNSCVLIQKWSREGFEFEEKEQNENSLKNLLKDGAKTENMNGYLSDASRRHLKGISENYLMAVDMTTGLKYGHASKVYPTFITLTMPSKQMHHDNFIKENCLRPFIDWLTSEKTYITRKGKSKGLQQGCGVKAYVWRAESQENGNIHFHLIVDRYIDKDQIRWRWNAICERFGYITRYRYTQEYRYRNGFCYTAKELDKQRKSIQGKILHTLKTGEMPNSLHAVIESDFIKAVQKGNRFGGRELTRLAVKVLEDIYNTKKNNNFTDPPSTQIIPIQNAKSVTAYITKYIAKGADEVLPQLLPNQEFVFYTDEFTNRTKKYISTFRTEKSDDGTEIKFEISRTEYKPIFKTRMVRGRLWGRADILNRVVEHPKIVAHSWSRIEEEVCKTREIIKTVPEYHYNLFGETVAVGTKQIVTKELTYDTEIKYKVDEHPTAWNYVETLREVVGLKQIREATSKVGGSFEAFGGEIIPVYQTVEDSKALCQKDYLQTYCPDLYTLYFEHYAQIFKAIYGDC